MSRSRLISAVIMGLALASCSTAIPAASPTSGPATPAAPRKAAARPTALALVSLPSPGSALPRPAALVPFAVDRGRGTGAWTPAGRAVGGGPAVYETTLIPPGGTQPAGIAWMDTGLLSARLYSGSVSPGGGPYRYTAPVLPAQARTLVAAFNGGFKMNDAHGGYYTEGRMIDSLRSGAASLVIYTDGTIDLGAWGSDVTMTSQVASVRQNLAPLVAAGVPRCAAQARTGGSGARHAPLPRAGTGFPASSTSGVRTGYRRRWGPDLRGRPGPWPRAVGPASLGRAGAVRGMELDINPAWPVFAADDPAPGAPVCPIEIGGRKLLSSTTPGPATFFEASWARDFVTMLARPVQ